MWGRPVSPRSKLRLQGRTVCIACCKRRSSRCAGRPRHCAPLNTASSLPGLAPQALGSLRFRRFRDGNQTARLSRSGPTPVTTRGWAFWHEYHWFGGGAGGGMVLRDSALGIVAPACPEVSADGVGRCRFCTDMRNANPRGLKTPRPPSCAGSAQPTTPAIIPHNMTQGTADLTAPRRIEEAASSDRHGDE
jgi:hypothetical protein